METNHINDQVKAPNYRLINQVLQQIKKTAKYTMRSTVDA
jgi:ribosomal protein S10